MDINHAASQNIKNIREQKKLTLDAAARITGVSRSMLAQIEKGDANPTLSVLWKIANGYKVSFTSLVENSEEQVAVIPFDTIHPIAEDEGKYMNYPAFCFDEKKGFETYRIVIEPEGKLKADPHLAGTEEYITVFTGTAEISVGDDTYLLKEGDSIRFQADVPHEYKNIGEQQVTLSMLIYYSN